MCLMVQKCILYEDSGGLNNMQRRPAARQCRNKHAMVRLSTSPLLAVLFCLSQFGSFRFCFHATVVLRRRHLPSGRRQFHAQKLLTNMIAALSLAVKLDCSKLCVLTLIRVSETLRLFQQTPPVLGSLISNEKICSEDGNNADN